jgi:hypothetical protein
MIYAFRNAVNNTSEHCSVLNVKFMEDVCFHPTDAAFDVGVK